MVNHDSMKVTALLNNICAFLSEPEECHVCGRPSFLDCNDDPVERYACWKVRKAAQGRWSAKDALHAIIETGILSDVRGDQSGGHLLAEARASIRTK